MNSQDKINKIKEKHNQLYDEVIKNSKGLIENETERNSFVERIKDLIKEIHDYAGYANKAEDYIWLTESTAQWQTLLLSTLNVPIDLGVVPLPTEPLLPNLPDDKALTETELNDWHSKFADTLGISRLRKLKRISSKEEMEQDWYNAQVYLASDILNGFPNFASRISSASYWRLEEVWIKSVKKLRAYFIWQKEKEESEYSRDRDHYYFKACSNLRDMIVNRDIKARIEEFGEAKTYIENQYIVNGKLNKQKPATEMLIARKAKRIWQKTGETDENKNWNNAFIYTSMFYENIIPAVLDKDKDRILSVLKAFQYSKTPENQWWIINCFEVALVIYFLDPEVVQNIWDDSESYSRPQSVLVSRVPVYSWPSKYEIPLNCKEQFKYNGYEIVFNGLMTTAQKEALVEKLKDEAMIFAVDELFNQSRLVHRDTTL